MVLLSVLLVILVLALILLIVRPHSIPMLMVFFGMFSAKRHGSIRVVRAVKWTLPMIHRSRVFQLYAFRHMFAVRVLAF